MRIDLAVTLARSQPLFPAPNKETVSILTAPVRPR